MIKINVFVSNKSWRKHIKNPDIYLKKKVTLLNKKNNFFKNRDVSFSLLLSGNKEIKIINKKFRKKNKHTDVLSFPYTNIKNLNLIKNKKIYIGDIAVCYQVIFERSKKSNFIKEFDKVWVHGFLHLLGYNHIKNKDYFKMSKFENRILNLL